MTNSPEKIRVLLIEDSGFMRILISEILRQDHQLSVIATATNGKEGIAKAEELKPDVVVTDMMMPDYDGLFVVRSLTKKGNIPVILLSSLERTDQSIFESLKAGAFDFIDKPRSRDEGLRDYQLIPLIKAAAKRTVTLSVPSGKNIHHHTFCSDLRYDALLIGASTGGPGAIEFILENLPANFALPIIIAQHMPERFIQTFAERLNAKGLLPISIAQKDMMAKPGKIYIAGGFANLILQRDNNGSIWFDYTEKQFPEFNYPSIDCLFESAAKALNDRVIAIILTGMGKDGMRGLIKIKSKGGFTIAQDESTSVVYGMPRSAFEAGAVDQVLKLQEIPGFVVSSLS